MSKTEKTKIIRHCFDEISEIHMAALSNDALDAILYIIARVQPITKIRSISIDPYRLRAAVLQEYQRLTPNMSFEVLEFLHDAHTTSDVIIERAKMMGLCPFNLEEARNLPKGGQLRPTLAPVGQESMESLIKRINAAGPEVKIAELAKQKQAFETTLAERDFEFAELNKRIDEENLLITRLRAEILSEELTEEHSLQRPSNF